jgi:hypothetical protein
MKERREKQREEQEKKDWENYKRKRKTKRSFLKFVNQVWSKVITRKK